MANELKDEGFAWILGTVITALMLLPGGRDLQTSLSNRRIIAEEGVLDLKRGEKKV